MALKIIRENAPTVVITVWNLKKNLPSILAASMPAQLLTEHLLCFCPCWLLVFGPGTRVLTTPITWIATLPLRLP
jgi:hypothetical protein